MSKGANVTWDTVALRQICERTIQGGTPPTQVLSFWDGHIPWITGADFGNYKISQIRRHITEGAITKSATNIVPAGSILIVTRTGVGKIAISDFDVAISQDITGLILKHNKADDVFIFYHFQHNAEELQKLNQGTSINGILRDDLLNYRIELPPVHKQKKIADILTTIDNLIEQTEAAIAKYQAIKQGMMHDLFTRGVDANGRLRPPREEAPDLYKESELGWIPKEWKVKAFGQILESNPQNGYSPKEVDEWQGVYMLGLGCLTPDGFQPNQLKYAPANDRKIPYSLLCNGDILLSRSNTIELVGLVGIYTDIGEPCIYPDLMMRLTPKQSFEQNYIETTLRHPMSRRQIISKAQGTSSSMVKINSENIKSILILIPSEAERTHVIEKFTTIESQITVERKRLQKYRTVKSGLMQDLLSGRVRVPTDPAPTQEPRHAS